MTSPRNLLLLALAFLGYLLYSQWQQDYGAGANAAPPQTTAAGTPTPSSASSAADVPSASGNAPATATAPPPTSPSPASDGASVSPRIVVTTDVLRVEIDTRGGSVVVADLLAYPQAPKDFAHPVRLFDDSREHFFEAQSGLVSANGVAPDHTATFTAEKTAYTLADNADSIEVPLSWTDASGLAVTKTFVFHRASYAIEQRQSIVNKTASAWNGNVYRQLQRVPPVVDTHGIKAYSNTERYSFIGAAYYNASDKFQKLKFDNFEKEPLNKSFAGGWAAMLQHYFFAAWIPDAAESDHYSTAIVQGAGETRYLIRTESPPVSIAPGETRTIDTARIYVGPKLQSTLDSVAPGLSLTVDYGVFTVIAEPLHWILAQIHKVTGNWGFAIILLVVLIKLVFFKLSETQFRSMARMRKMQPRIESLKERYGDDRQKLNQAMLELYQKEKINPLGGCLPMLVQIPVFFALYWVLLESVELRQAPFILWIQNLSAPDPWYVLPFLNGLAMIATQLLTPSAGMDPMQARMMKIMPVAFSVLFAFFPAGLVLYWTANGSLSLLQQWVITRRIERADKAKA
jgi:YidC/Oxa1 family membrane protein insertase